MMKITNVVMDIQMFYFGEKYRLIRMRKERMKSMFTYKTNGTCSTQIDLDMITDSPTPPTPPGPGPGPDSRKLPIWFYLKKF